MIVGRGVMHMDQTTENKTYADYSGIIYPMGLSIAPDYITFFNHDDISEVVFKGFWDTEDGQFLSMYHDWKSETTDGNSKDLNKTFLSNC